MDTEDNSHERSDGPDPRLLRDGLTARGFTFQRSDLSRFPFNPLARKGTFYAGFDPLRALRILVLHRDADFIIPVGESSIVIVLLLAKLFRFKPLILLREISGQGWTKRDRIVRFVLARVDGVLALTPHQVKIAQSLYRMKASPDLVGFAIDERFFHPQPCEAAPKASRYVLSVGDDAGRDYETLIDACRDTPYRLVLRTGLEVQIPDDMRGRVTILDHLSYVDLRGLYAAASIVVVPLKLVDHPSGITSLFEGLAMARPVIASDIGSTQHVLQHQFNGLLVPPVDVMALRAALIELMEDRPLAEQLGAEGRATIERTQSYSAYVDRFADALRRHAQVRREQRLGKQTRYRWRTRKQPGLASLEA